MDSAQSSQIFIGLMSGTSLDGVDAVAAAFTDGKYHYIARSFEPYSQELRRNILSLCFPGNDEISRMQLVGNDIAKIYAKAVKTLLMDSGLNPEDVVALGAHGQTIRHSPDVGVSTQIINSALLAELTGIDVVCDFRSRDLAAGGQGAPLVPAFHADVFSSGVPRAIVNIGGISNITVIDPGLGGSVLGFDCGPGNVLLDYWIQHKKAIDFDCNGDWARQGKIDVELLNRFLEEPFFGLHPPKSTGRELFNPRWLNSKLSEETSDEDVQRTLLELTVLGISRAINQFAPSTEEIYLCGGGARNAFLVSELQNKNPDKVVDLTDAIGIDTQDVEGAAFAWLAWRFVRGLPGNKPSVTGARGERVLGCLYPA